MTAPWGATPDDWTALMALGLTTDLLPVVSRPDATISPNSSMQSLGKTPSRYDGSGHVVGIPRWTQLLTQERAVARWSTQPDLGICIQTRRVRAIDIDIGDPARAAEVQELIGLVFDLPARRRSNSGKCLLVFDMPGSFNKRVIKTPDGIIEFLAGGQQFIACGTHTSGARYKWDSGLPAVIPTMDPDEFEMLWSALVAAFALPGGAAEQRAGTLPSVRRLASDSSDPLVPWLEAEGWVTGSGSDGRVDVRCPFEAGHSSDTGPSSTSYFPVGVGGFAQGHFRCLHASCMGRTDGDYLEATGYVASEFDVVVPLANAKGEPILGLPVFARDKKTGAPLATVGNVQLALRRPDVCGHQLGFDEFKGALMLKSNGGGWRPLTDTDYTRLRVRLEERRFKPVGGEMTKDCVRLVGDEQRFDSAIDWANTLTWDGVPRVDTFFASYFSAEDTPYTRAVARYMWSAMGGRCLEPGCKADMAPVLIGMQGVGKSSAIELLAPIPESFTEVDLQRSDDENARKGRGKLIVELAELRGLQSRDAEGIKSWVSRRVEEWTPKYLEHTTRYKRRFVLIGTSNKDEFLDDETGERRWLPLHVGVVDTTALAADRDQLWAEGLAMFRSGGVRWRDAYELAKAEHAKFKISDPWQELIAAWLACDDFTGPRAGAPVRLEEVMVSALGFKPGQIGRRDWVRAGKVMRSLGYEKKKREKNGQAGKVWILVSSGTIV